MTGVAQAELMNRSKAISCRLIETWTGERVIIVEPQAS